MKTLLFKNEASFQFQYGTIKRNWNSHVEYCELPFQFQYGTIKRHKINQCSNKTIISIPVWYD